MEKKKMNKIKFRVDELNKFRELNKTKLKNGMKIFNNCLLDKCSFIYFMAYGRPEIYRNIKKKHKPQLESFMSIVSLCHYIYHGKKIKIPTCEKDTYQKIDKFFKNNKHIDYSNQLYCYESKNMDSFNEMEFVSLVFYTTFLLRKTKFEINNCFTSKQTLKDKFFDTIPKIDTDMSKLFKLPKKIGVFYHFKGRFESGIDNIFKGVIPKNIDEDELYKFIVKFDSEIKNMTFKK